MQRDTVSEATVSELAARAARGDRKALSAFVGLGDAALPGVIRGLGDPDWKVRRSSLRFLDHHMDAETTPLVIERLRDEHPDVRKWAAHALGCAHCKCGSELGLDPVPHLVRAAREDPSLRVRRSAVVSLACNLAADARVRALLAELLETERDPKIRRHAEYGLSCEGGVPATA